MLAVVALRAALQNKDYVFDFVTEHNTLAKPKFGARAELPLLTPFSIIPTPYLTIHLQSAPFAS
eukprot:scaffold25046_cov64-Isochrysis_galbana.AAC.1